MVGTNADGNVGSSRRTAVSFDEGFVTMTLRTPCCEQQIERPRLFFFTGARNVCCQDRYQITFEGDLANKPIAVWTLD